MSASSRQPLRSWRRVLALVLALASPAWGAPALVQTVTGSATASPVSTTLTLTAGNAVLIVIDLNGVTAPVQTAGDAVTQRCTQADGGLNQYQFNNDAAVAGGSTTFTFSYTGAGDSRIFVIEVSGLQNGAAAFDKTAGTTFTTATTHASGTTATTTAADELLLASFHFDGSAITSTASLDNSFTVPGSGSPPTGNQLNFTNTMPSLIATRIVSATGAYTTTLTSDSGPANGLICTYKAAAAGRGLFLPGELTGTGVGGSFFRTRPD